MTKATLYRETRTGEGEGEGEGRMAASNTQHHPGTETLVTALSSVTLRRSFKFWRECDQSVLES